MSLEHRTDHVGTLLRPACPRKIAIMHAVDGTGTTCQLEPDSGLVFRQMSIIDRRLQDFK
jgi:hypothetical protein